ncbi:MAG TPA: methyltransferase domain-containing protein [Alphaproteobacteria bacterium]|nr:methyltransferase domain-containing protein [Alphaproteobacteria bacterium]
MHQTSMDTMRKFVNDNNLRENKVVVDIGSYDFNGSYRMLFDSPKSRYIGVDIQYGNGVDLIFDSAAWHYLKDVDAVISGQTFEHVQNVPYLLMKIHDILKPGGLLCIITPSEGPRHDCPIWTGNYTIKQMTELVKSAGFIVDSCKIDPTPVWCDLCCIAHKKERENENKQR